MAKPKMKKTTKLDDFESVAKRLGCDQDLKAFDKKLGKIALARPNQGKRGRKR